MRTSAVVVLLVVLAGCAPPPEKPPVLPTPEELRTELTGLPFDDFVDVSFRELMRRYPEWVVELGLQSSIDVGHGFLNEASDELDQETAVDEQVVLDVLGAHDRAALTRAQQITFDTYA